MRFKLRENVKGIIFNGIILFNVTYFDIIFNNHLRINILNIKNPFGKRSLIVNYF